MPYWSLCSLVFCSLKPFLPLRNTIWLYSLHLHWGPAELSWKGAVPSLMERYPGFLRGHRPTLGACDLSPRCLLEVYRHLRGLIRYFTVKAPRLNSWWSKAAPGMWKCVWRWGSGLGEECPESRGNSMRHVNMVRGTIYRLEGRGRLFISIFLCCSIFLWSLAFLHCDLPSHVLTLGSFSA